jgi:hypothetical protein
MYGPSVHQAGFEIYFADWGAWRQPVDTVFSGQSSSTPRGKIGECFSAPHLAQARLPRYSLAEKPLKNFRCSRSD